MITIGSTRAAGHADAEFQVGWAMPRPQDRAATRRCARRRFAPRGFGPVTRRGITRRPCAARRSRSAPLSLTHMPLRSISVTFLHHASDANPSFARVDYQHLLSRLPTPFAILKCVNVPFFGQQESEKRLVLKTA